MPDNEKANATISASRRQLADWWAEWALDQQLRGEKPATDVSAKSSVGHGTGTRYDLDAPRDGDVRLLHPSGPEWGPVYVLVLASETGADSDWVPFGRFSVPAMESEWKTGLRSAPLRVLCGWNARRPAANRWPPSWRVRRLEGITLERQRMFFQSVTSGARLEAKWRRQQGPPLCHPADPRHEYCDEEVMRLDAHGVALVSPVCVEEERATYLSEPNVPEVGWRAAESRPLYGAPIALYSTVDGDVTVAAVPVDSSQVRIQLVTKAGLPCVACDGGTLYAADEFISDRIENGMVNIPIFESSRLTTLQDAHGRNWRLKRR